MKKASTIVKEMEALANKKKVTPVKNVSNPNRDKWIEHTKNRLDAEITAKANEGFHELEYSLNDLVIGAENLNEAAEMCELLAEILTEHEFKHVIKEDGTFVISW